MSSEAPKQPAVFLRDRDAAVNADAWYRGLQNFYPLNNDVLYWDYGLSSLHILVRAWRKIVQHVIDGMLFVLLAGNVLVVYRIGSGVQFGLDDWLLQIFFGSSGFAGLFWVLSLFNFYLFYRIYHELTKARGTIKARHAENTKRERVNIAETMSRELAGTLDECWSQVNATRQFPIRSLHLLTTLTADDDVQLILARLGVSHELFREKVVRQVAKLPPESTESIMSDELRDVFLNAYLRAYEEGARRIRSTDILYAIVHAREIVQEILYDVSVDLNKVDNVIRWINFDHELYERYQRYRAKSVYKPKGAINRAYTAAATPYLDSFSTDLTQMARAARLSLSVARNDAIDEVFRIMESGKSVVLVGENGVGKFNIIEGIANRMVAEEVPKLFQDKRLASISLPFLVAGAGRTGEVQERLLLVIREIQRSGNIIVVIEDIHNLVGVSSAGTENIDLSEVLAGEIQNGSVRVIATTTPTDVTQYLERSALAGALERVRVSEPERNQAIQILEANVGLVENKHRVFFTYAAVEALVELSDRYLHDQFLPAKAINLMAELGSWVANRESKVITKEDVADLVSRKTKIPLTKIGSAESDTLLNLESLMHERIVGQDDAVRLVVSALRRARTELRDEKRPIVNMLFLGPTGVGKTELAKTVAATYFKDEDAMIRLDMSEYQTQDSIGRLLGVPGSGRGGALTESVRANPFSLLLLDEIEKAHPDILNIFLQVMDDGRLTDALGRTVDFTNVILVATSNAQANYIQDAVRKQTPVERIRDVLVRERLRETFRPEFLNRFDGIVVFKPLTGDEIFKIAGLMLKRVAQRLERKGISLQVSSEAQSELAKAGFDPEFGARPLRRVIQERVEESLANYLLKGEIGRRDVVVLHRGGEIEVKKAATL